MENTLSKLSALDLDAEDGIDEFLKLCERIHSRQTALFCPRCGASAQDRGDWYHCVPCGMAVIPVDAMGNKVTK